jgi:outer membrane protein assembly factor BamB
MVRRYEVIVALAISLACLVAFASVGGERDAPPATVEGPDAWRLLVMDPLSDQLACDCVAGYARRNYGELAEFLGQRWHRPVEIVYAESLASPRVGAPATIELIAGKFSEVVADAARAGIRVRSVAMLTGRDGSITQTGLFVVRQDDPAKSVQDLQGHRLLLGPEDAVEKHSAAAATLEAFRLPVPWTPSVKASCSAAALSVAEKESDAAIVSSYAMPLLEGCGTIDKGTLRVVGSTDPVPFIGLFVTERIGRQEEQEVQAALVEARDHPALLAALESREGFVRVPPCGTRTNGAVSTWPDWRGVHRDALSSDVPEKLPAARRLLWSRTLTGPGMSGLAVDSGRIVVADKDLDEKIDIFRCLDCDTGQELWRLAYPAAGKMDFTNAPRANPVTHQGLVYLLGAFGRLHCLKLDSGQIVWKKHLAEDFQAKRPNWGWSSTPLIVGDKLIVNPGAKDASLVALDRRDGTVLWSTPGDLPGYASLILAELGGKRQIVGYDAVSLGGWDPDTGVRLWRLEPPEPGDFNVPTPLAVQGKLLVSTENNGTRLYEFDNQGRIQPEPLAVNEDLAPDTATPVAYGDLVFGSSGRLMCLDLKAGLKTLWENDRDEFLNYCTVIAGNGHVLVVTQGGKVFLLRAAGDALEVRASLELFPDVSSADRDVWSHPALVGNRLYVRNMLGISCFVLE